MAEPLSPVTPPDAPAACAAVRIGGHQDWSVPRLDDLRALVRGCDATKIDGFCPTHDGCNSADCYPPSCHGPDVCPGPGPGRDGCYLDPAFPTCFQSNSSMHISDTRYFGVDFNKAVSTLTMGVYYYEAVDCVRTVRSGDH